MSTMEQDLKDAASDAHMRSIGIAEIIRTLCDASISGQHTGDLACQVKWLVEQQDVHLETVSRCV